MDDFLEYSVCDAAAGERLDKYLVTVIEHMSRSMLQKLIDEEAVLVNGQPSTSRYKLKTGDVVTVEIPEPKELQAVPENIPLDILYEDSDVIIVNKPKGMVVHPDNAHQSGTLVNGLLYHCKDLSGINGVLRPGIVHRIDMNTTGSVIACKNDVAHESIAEQLKNHTIVRRYVAIVCGNLKENEGTIEGPIGRSEKDRKKMAINYRNGKDAITHYTVLKQFKGFSLVECRLETGRTHQIRVHMASIGHPILGDDVYGGVREKYKTEGQCLHAKILGFIHPTSGDYIETIAPLPDYFEHLIQILELLK